MPSILQRSDYEDFLIHLYFSEISLQAWWRPAYRAAWGVCS